MTLSSANGTATHATSWKYAPGISRWRKNHETQHTQKGPDKEDEKGAKETGEVQRSGGGGMSGKRCLFCDEEVPADPVILTYLDHKWYFCNFNHMQERLIYNSEMLADIEGEVNMKELQG